jgi:hypothetical protein
LLLLNFAGHDVVEWRRVGVVLCGQAVNHFLATGSLYPLAVKLGTITPSGADVYSYAPDEDCMVTDAQLAEHLARSSVAPRDRQARWAISSETARKFPQKGAVYKHVHIVT